jgi:hypothetical protein
MTSRFYGIMATAMLFFALPLGAYTLHQHPRIFVNQASLPQVAQRATGVLGAEYDIIKAVADSAVSFGIPESQSRFRPPMLLVCSGICYMVETQAGNKSAAKKYVKVIKKYWGDGAVLDLEGDGYFGYNAMVYDWVYPALSRKERKRYGDRLGAWLRWYTDTPEILNKNGNWRYNQTWGPAHLNTPNTRDGITPKLMVALAIAGSDSKWEDDARRFLESWETLVPTQCVPSFEEMGEVWSESMGHGGYGPIVVIPWAFEAWRTATGQDFFQLCTPTGYLPGMTKWAAHLTVPFSDNTAPIDDNIPRNLSNFARVAPILAARYGDPVANWISDRSAQENWRRVPWNRFLSYEPAVRSAPPWERDYQTAAHFTGAGHVYMRSGWNDPDATWAFFGAGPKFAGHSRDDESHFLISKGGWLASRSGGPGHNDRDYYAGGSIAFNVLTVFDPQEKFRRLVPGDPKGVRNENDGGMKRWVYTSHGRDDRAQIVAYHHREGRYTYAAAEMTQAYREHKVNEVTRQFFYLRAPREFFIVFDRVEATDRKFAKHWFLHMPAEPRVSAANEEVETAGHVFSYSAATQAAWTGDPAGEKLLPGVEPSKVFLSFVLPQGARVVKRGGADHQFWGHPLEPTAQYNHVGGRSHQLPIVPWRLEVASPNQSEREYFLHVFEVAGFGQAKATPVKLLEVNGWVGVQMDVPGQEPVAVYFRPSGPLTACLQKNGGMMQALEPWTK